MIRFCRNLANPSPYSPLILLLLLVPLLLLLPLPFLLLCSNFNVVENFESLTQLPLIFQSFEKWISPNWVVSIDDYGAKGNGVNDDTKAFMDAWEAVCSCSSRSVLEIPAGKIYLVGPIDFGGPCQSKVSGTVVAPKNPEIWDGLNPRKWLYFHGVDHLTVGGGGNINGMGEKWWARSCKINTTNPCRHAPTAVTFHRCSNLKVRKLMILNSQQVHIAFTNCYKVKVSHLKIIAPVDSPNTDAIHISASKRVEVRDSIIETGDDCISIVSNTSAVRIKNIACGPGHGISIGSLGKHHSCDEVQDVLVDGAFLSNTENGVRIKTWQGGSGFVRDIDFRNVWMNNVSNPIIIDQYYCDSQIPCPNQTLSVKVERVSFRGISGTSATEEAIFLACSDSFPCEKILLNNIQLFYVGGNTSSYCWKASGTSFGPVYPHPCFSCDEHFIKYKVLSSTAHCSIS
ncbi:probable polygalacturonase At1g80170 isoform X2 [Magnolia sinica]|uniref:probable polygalacturonase At1g80170 isoform X2 n=1 Tax=Magnolia sinica TaxID=86752 RepID=UPI0026585448|nr:probable polygalacturonase At1g80170 isoform X2 [Magnolia sinica]